MPFSNGKVSVRAAWCPLRFKIPAGGACKCPLSFGRLLAPRLLPRPSSAARYVPRFLPNLTDVPLPNHGMSLCTNYTSTRSTETPNQACTGRHPHLATAPTLPGIHAAHDPCLTAESACHKRQKYMGYCVIHSIITQHTKYNNGEN